MNESHLNFTTVSTINLQKKRLEHFKEINETNHFESDDTNYFENYIFHNITKNEIQLPIGIFQIC